MGIIKGEGEQRNTVRCLVLQWDTLSKRVVDDIKVLQIGTVILVDVGSRQNRGHQKAFVDGIGTGRIVNVVGLCKVLARAVKLSGSPRGVKSVMEDGSSNIILAISMK